MSSLQKYLIASASVLFFAVVLNAGIFVMRTGQFNLNDYLTRFRGVISSKEGPEFVNYDGQYVDGKKVRAMMEKYGGEYFLRVSTQEYPVSFAVYNKPVSGYICTGNSVDGKLTFENYTKSTSKYYVNENGLFYVTMIYNDGADGIGTSESAAIEAGGGGHTVIGVCFDQKDLGSLSNSVKEDFKQNTILASKKVYVNRLKDNIGALQNDAIYSWKNSLTSALSDMATEVENIDVTVHQQPSQVRSLQKKIADLKSDLNEAWYQYEQAYITNTAGTDPLLVSHAEINDSSTSDKDNVNSLAYWIDRFTSSADEDDWEDSGDDE